ncbi:MAG TPA: hypothetical protein VL241_09875 [Gemmatimonadales bacterium]|nr:hypothetical protein [Gemmatimonadales bacterium]
MPLTLALTLTLTLVQAPNPPYLAQFPTVAKVKQVMTDKDPREQALKQLGALWQLQEIMKQLSGSREFRGLLPDEQKVLGSYQVAEYYLSKATDSTFPGPYGRGRTVSDNTPYRYMRSDPRFGIEGISTFRLLLTPQIQDSFYRSVGLDNAKIAARKHADSVAIAAIGNPGNGPPGAKTDAETMQIRRCAESGRSELQCMMEGIGKSFTGMMTAAMPGLGELLKKTPIQGIRMSGVYPGEGKLGFTFYNDYVTVACSEIVPESHEYAVSVVPAGLRITIVSAPKNVVLTLRPDGRLQGAGPTDFTGQVQVGIEYGTRTWSDGRTEPISRPVFETQTRRCNVGVLAPSAASSALGNASTAPAALLNLAFGDPDPAANKAPPVGARMSGEFGSQAALDLEFRPEGVVLGCGEVTSLKSYTVQPSGNVAVIRVANGATPLELTYSSDGKLSGTGSVKVDGRQVTGTNGSGGLNYVPRSASCPLASLNPAAPQLTEAELGAQAARASLGRPATPAAPSAAAANGKGPAFVQIESGFPKETGGVPLAGRTVILMDADLERVFREAGIAVGLDSKYVGPFNKAYDAGGEPRRKLLQAITEHTVGYIPLDKDGIGKSPELTVGKTYSFLAQGTVGGTKYMWALTGVATPGWTKVVLTTANALKN